MTTVFYGMIPTDGDDGERSWAYPWRFDGVECDDEDALDRAQGLVVLSHDPDDCTRAEFLAMTSRDRDAHACAWRTRVELRRDRRARPVTLLRIGRNANTERFVLAIRDSMSHVDVMPIIYATAAPDQSAQEWPRILDEWAAKLGIPRERRGVVGWFAFGDD